jgi:hypothetical protein
MDGAIFPLLQYSHAPKGPGSATESDYQIFLNEKFGTAGASLIEQHYPVSAFNSTPFPAFYAMAAAVGYANYVCTAHRGLNTAVSNNIPVWTYNFAHTPHCTWLPSLPQTALPLVGATHTCEIPFVFGHTTNLPNPDGNCSMTTTEIILSKFMMGAWTSMASSQIPIADDSLWPAYRDSKESLGINIGGGNGSSALLRVMWITLRVRFGIVLIRCFRIKRKKPTAKKGPIRQAP